MVSSLILYSFRRCPFAIRARMVLEEKGIPYQIREEDLSNLSSDLLALHPEGRVPLLVHQIENTNHVIFQSSIITEYLDERFSDFALMPRDALGKAKVRLWTYWCDHLFKPDLDLFKYERPELSAADAHALESRLHQALSRWENALQEGPFLLGTQFTLADVHLFPFARQFISIKPSLPGLEKYLKIADWLSRIVSRPAFKRVMTKV